MASSLLMDTEVEYAKRLATLAHSGQLREGGEPYITHPLRVADLVVSYDSTTTAMVAASMLHDVVEDTGFTVDDLMRVQSLSADTVALVDVLTKRKEGVEVYRTGGSEWVETHREYIERIAVSGMIGAVVIKTADLIDNWDDGIWDGSVLPGLDRRYRMSIAILAEAHPRVVPNMVKRLAKHEGLLP